MNIFLSEQNSGIDAWWRSCVGSRYTPASAQNPERHSHLFESLSLSALRRQHAHRDNRLGIFRASLWGWIVIGILTALIGFVSISDTYWSFKNQDVLYTYEKNPVGRWLIDADGGDVALFMTVKMVGTMLVIALVPLLYRIRKWWGLTVAVVLAGFQSLLFCYLNCTERIPLYALLESL